MSRARRPFAVFIRFTVSPSDVEELTDLITTMLMEIGPYLASQPGFLGSRTHRSLDGTQITNYILWRSQADHETAMASPEMEAAGGPLMEWVEAGRARFDVELCEVLSGIAPPT